MFLLVVDKFWGCSKLFFVFLIGCGPQMKNVCINEMLSFLGRCY